MTLPVINVVSAKLIAPYRIALVFDDQHEQEVNFLPFLTHSHHPEIRAYLEPARFAAFHVQHGELVWGDYDLCFPVADLYRNNIEHTQTLAAAA